MMRPSSQIVVDLKRVADGLTSPRKASIVREAANYIEQADSYLDKATDQILMLSHLHADGHKIPASPDGIEPLAKGFNRAIVAHFNERGFKDVNVNDICIAAGAVLASYLTAVRPEPRSELLEKTVAFLREECSKAGEGKP